MAIHFFEQEVRVKQLKRLRLKQYLPLLFRSEGKELRSLTCVFCSDAFLLQMNQHYLRHDTFTDIITFDLSDNSKGAVTGELYISWPRVVENAEGLNIPVQQELHRVIFHGALHLCGYKDKRKADQQLMRAKEQTHLEAFERFK